jgi:hypothetical protein
MTRADRVAEELGCLEGVGETGRGAVASRTDKCSESSYRANLHMAHYAPLRRGFFCALAKHRVTCLRSLHDS